MYMKTVKIEEMNCVVTDGSYIVFFIHFIKNKYSMTLSTQLHRPYFSNQISGQGTLFNSKLDIQITRKYVIVPPCTTIDPNRFLL